MIAQEEILKQFVQHVAALNAAKVAQGTEEIEVVFETHLDGMRYYVARGQCMLNSEISLTPREQAIATLVAQGLSNKCIGKNLNISPWTVATHIRRIFSKLGVKSRSEMVARLMEENVLYFS